MRERILIVEDDAKTTAVLRLYLEASGYQVVSAADGTSGLRRARRGDIDLVVLDLMLPEVDGRTLCRALRREHPVPVVMLTARTTEEDRLRGFDAGADDYVSKPFSPRELVARVRAVLRRVGGRQAPSLIVCGALRLDRERQTLTAAGRSIDLTPTELRLVTALMTTPGRVFSRSELIERAFGRDFEGSERTVDTHIRNLRRKIEPRTDSADPMRYIETVHGLGYRLADHDQPA